jgi:hypothetical protein
MHRSRLNNMMNIATLPTLLLAAGLFGSCSKQDFNLSPASENFAQSVKYAKDIDVLWMIDTSGSMDKRQALLQAEVPGFMSALNQTGLNYQMAVTTMDMSSTGEHGKFLAQPGTPSVLTVDTPNLGSVLAERIRVGGGGSPLNRGEEAMKAALTLATTPASSFNQGFLRPNSLLVVIFLSDEDDKSAQDNYAAYLDSIRPPLASGERSWVANFMGVVPDQVSCPSSDWGFSSAGLRFMALADASGGLTESICDADLKRALTNVKARVLEVVTEYPLSSKPMVSTIKVTVDGNNVVSDAVNGWTYLATANAIRFHGTAIPRAGADIHVDFTPDGIH